MGGGVRAGGLAPQSYIPGPVLSLSRSNLFISCLPRPAMSTSSEAAIISLGRPLNLSAPTPSSIHNSHAKAASVEANSRTTARQPANSSLSISSAFSGERDAGLATPASDDSAATQTNDKDESISFLASELKVRADQIDRCPLLLDVQQLTFPSLFPGFVPLLRRSRPY